MRHFFVSYTQRDHQWAEWVAWELEHAGFSVFVQAWDILPGSNFVTQMRLASQDCERTIAILSNAYLESLYAEAEWNAAFADDPTGEKRKLIPVRIEECEPRGIDRPIVYLDLVGLDDGAAKERLIATIAAINQESRLKPPQRPPFPKSGPREPLFPDQGSLSPDPVSAWNVAIISTEFVGLSKQRALTYEANELQLEFGFLGATVLLLDPIRIALGIRDDCAKVGYVDGNEVNWSFFDSIDTLLIRRTRSDDTSVSDTIYDLVSFLSVTNPKLRIIDPPASFGRPTSKIPSMLKRAKAGIAQGTRVLLSRRAIQQMVKTFAYPVVVKPVHGWQGLGVEKCDDANELLAYLRRGHDDVNDTQEFPLIIEQHLTKRDEFRVIVVGDQAVGCVSKQEVSNEIARNRAKGSIWTVTQNPTASEIAKVAARAHGISIAGVDIAQTDRGYVVIECNRNPQFAAFDRATGQSVAKSIARYAFDLHRGTAAVHAG
ncbi:TIR domain-containing protein [Mycolicibacterium pulveris]|uniref:TIR domain-containing protein n=1 Tax=Mycolicibacterium pulveris TaxID=36813 RepID=UPI003CFAD7C9